MGMIGRRDVLRFSSAILVAGALEVQHRAPAKSAARGARIVVIGGGFGGSSCALQLRALDPTLSVTVVDPDDLYVTCPMSNGVLAGLRTLQSLTISRQGIKRRGVTYLRDRAVRVETEKHQVMLASGKQLEYDKVVVAPGIRMLFGTPEGYDEAAAHVMPHAWIAGPQTQLLADRLHRMRDGGVVAISVPAGPMRCPPGPFERATLIAAYLKRTKPRSKVLIYDSNNHFPRQDAFSAAWERLYPGMIQWIPVVDGGKVVRVDPREMELYTSNGKQAADVINIIPPQAPALLAVESGLAQPRGWCPVDPQTFESQNAKDVHVIGDACIADPMPKAASAAVSQ